MENITMAISGGLLIGIAASMMLLINGRILGVSGILGGLLDRREKFPNWRLSFLGGLLIGGIALRAWMPEAFDVAPARPIAWIVLAGFLVGIGTRLGNGCTSGHGICGVSRLSPRSILATCVFVAVGMLVATVAKQALGGAP